MTGVDKPLAIRTIPDMTTLDEPDRVRPWPGPRCHGCRSLVASTGVVRTLSFDDDLTPERLRYRFLFCGSCGTAFASGRVFED